MRTRPGWIVSLVIALAIVIAPEAWSDGTQTGSIGGTVRDAAGGPLPGTAVTAKSVRGGFTRDTVTSANGTYGIHLLPIGEYALTVALSGFGKVATTVTVAAEKNTQFDAQLKMSTISETVNVSAELPVVDKTQTATQTNVDSKFTQKLAVGRSYQSLLQLAPGVTGGANPNVHGALS